MKTTRTRTITLFLITLIFFSCGGSKPAVLKNNNLKSKTVRVLKTDQAQLYNRADHWMHQVVTNPNSKILQANKESGRIIGKQLLGKLTNKGRYINMEYTFAIINVLVTDNSAKIEIEHDFSIFLKKRPYLLYSKEEAKADIATLLTSFEKAIQSKNPLTKTDLNASVSHKENETKSEVYNSVKFY